MNREIKFRGLAVNSKEMIFSETISYGIIKRKVHDVFLEVAEGQWKEIVRNTLGQYTGQMTASYCEIYEGDIVRFKNDLSGNWEIGVIRFYAGSFLVCNFRGKSYMSKLFVSEIVGNIHQNPELLTACEAD